MDLITGYFRHTRKTKCRCESSITLVYISEISDPNMPDEYFVCDEYGCVPILTCVKDNKIFDGCLKYKLGSKNKCFELSVQQCSDAGILINGRCLYVHSKDSGTPTRHLIFSKGTLNDNHNPSCLETAENEESRYCSSANDICEEYQKCCSTGHALIVASFLKSIVPECHTRFSHFCISNVEPVYGQVLSCYISGVIVHHTITSSVFLNFNELFSKQQFFTKLDCIPYFPHTNFIISSDWKQVYESREYVFAYNYPFKFLRKVLGLILLEERIVFYSAQDSSLKVMQILDLVRPFKWHHIVCIPLLDEMCEILESPLPFIVCTKSRIEIKGVMLVDLDSLTIHGGKRSSIPLRESKESIAKKNSTEGIKSCIRSIVTEVTFWREYLIKRHGSEILELIVDDPSAFIGKKHGFYCDFFKTRMFLMFFTRMQSHLCRYLVEIGRERSVTLLPYAVLCQEAKPTIMNLWIELFDGDMNPVIDYLLCKNMLQEVAGAVLKRLSHAKNHDGIRKVISHLNDPKHDVFMNINTVSEMPCIDFGDLYFYKVFHLKACECRAFEFDDGNPEPNSNGYDRKKIQSEIRNIITSIDQDAFDESIAKCKGCTAKRSMILVCGPDKYVYFCFLLAPENIIPMLKYFGCCSAFEKAPQAYWSTVVYFMYFNLPLKGGLAGKKVDVMMKEKELPELGLRLDGRPLLYINP
ncbi:hypothetical protein HK407_04g06510 [Ordospora pajunii]|uniref:uncharacterized protein n=1 Tax=Ordospora pajunii TaxID=3039483 RepID=UPI0029526CB5|nr:uncharacterized protein HK407_04g06510 [Ordospora pajunii]KAH9411549.1 hypothetical protein HK407_04g06510 [Ordospora pajunii]